MPWPTTLATFMRTLAMPAAAELWSLTSLREKQSKIGREGRQPWPLRHPPDGRGRGAMTDVPGNPVADHPVADTVRAGMRSAGPDATNDDGKRCASMQAKLRVSVPRRSQLIGSTLAAHAVRDLPLPMTVQGAILGPTTAPNPGNVGFIPSNRPCCGMRSRVGIPFMPIRAPSRRRPRTLHGE